jgi:hypothetical protein
MIVGCGELLLQVLIAEYRLVLDLATVREPQDGRRAGPELDGIRFVGNSTLSI